MPTPLCIERIASVETAVQYLAGGQSRMDTRLDRIEAKVDRLAIIMIVGSSACSPP